MDVYLLLLDDARSFFYSAEEEKEQADAEVESEGLPQPAKGWTSRIWAKAAARLERLKETWQHAETGLMGKAHLWWDWLHTFIHPQESLLVRLYWARRLDVHHPASRSGDVRAIWQNYLRGRFLHHLLWFAINTLIVPFVALLAILPGPNFIGFWFTYRAIHHGLIVLGIRRARLEKVPTAFLPSEALDQPVDRDESGHATHPIFEGGRNHHRLHVYYEWAGGARSAPQKVPPGGPR